MRKHFSILAVLISMVIIVVMLAACSGSENKPGSPTETVSGTNPIETDTSVAAAGGCRLALLLPGLATNDVTIQTGAREIADQEGCQLDVYAAEDHPEKMVLQINEAGQKKVRGIIIKPIDHTDVESAVQQASKLGIPVVVIGNGLPAIQTNRVIPDFIDGAKQAATFVCGAVNQHGNIVQLVDSQIDGADGLVSKAFSDGIQTSCPEAKLTTVPVKGSGEDAAKKAMLQVLSADQDISAVFTYTESAMNGAINADLEAGILGVVTAELGQETEAIVTDPTRVVDAVLLASGSEIGKAAVQSMLAQVNGTKAEPKIVIPMQISLADISFQLPPDPTSKRITIGVLLPDEADPFYQQIYKGLLSPSRSLDNVTLKIRSGNNDPLKMIKYLDWMVDAKVDAILVSPVEDPNLLIAIDRVARSDIPLVTLGVALEMDKIVSQISFDEYAIGFKAGEYLCSALGDTGTIADVYDSTNPNREAVRTHGLLDYQQANCPEVKIITRPLPVGIGPACEELKKFISEAGPFDGIFAHSDELGLCAVDSSSTKFVIGVGASANAFESIKAGKLSATVGQFPYEMGVIAMETTIEYLYGKPVEPNKPFPVNLITKDSLK